MRDDEGQPLAGDAGLDDRRRRARRLGRAAAADRAPHLDLGGQRAPHAAPADAALALAHGLVQSRQRVGQAGPQAHLLAQLGEHQLPARVALAQRRRHLCQAARRLARAGLRLVDVLARLHVRAAGGVAGLGRGLVRRLDRLDGPARLVDLAGARAGARLQGGELVAVAREGLLQADELLARVGHLQRALVGELRAGVQRL